MVKKFLCEVHGVGGVWVAITMILGVAALSISDIPKRNANGELLDILTLAATIGAVTSFLIGFFTLLKQRWSLYVGLVFGYFGIFVMVLLLAKGNVCGAIVGILLYLAVIVQTHRAINLANLMLLHNIPLNTKPEMS